MERIISLRYLWFAAKDKDIIYAGRVGTDPARSFTFPRTEFILSAMTAKTLTLPSYAKVNLDLQIAGRREDGFHDICTIFQTISLADTLHFEVADEISITCSDERVPTDDRNLVIKAAKELSIRAGVKRGAAIRLEKVIPSPGGLGGGSSNAAVTLLALNKLWDLRVTPNELLEIAAALGSDVPFFLYGGTAIGTGRGGDIEQIGDFVSGHMIVVTPDVEVSTAEAYAGLIANRLTKEAANRILLNYRFWAASADLNAVNLKNDFEKTVFAAFPKVAKAKAMLLEFGAAKALMSGSGASVFGIFDNQETRQTALKALGNESNWRSFAVATVSREIYRGAFV